MIALVDYGAGNLTSVRKALAAIDAQVFTPSGPRALADASAIVVPGVGHFDAISALDSGWRDAILGAAGQGVPLLGICLGLQWLFEGSREAPHVSGLGLFQGLCERLPDTEPEDPSTPSASQPRGRLKVPHVGWNSLSFPRATPLMAGVPPGGQVYFTHSYAAPVVPETAATTSYGAAFTAAVQRDRITGLQFHPEKSGDIGLRILRNWLQTVPVRHG